MFKIIEMFLKTPVFTGVFSLYRVKLNRCRIVEIVQKSFFKVVKYPKNGQFRGGLLTKCPIYQQFERFLP